ncbi:MAG: zinc-ribbon domain-containing protein [Candidatus Nealsonbacteria bacterium]|nr:zinc-ribbon domain-containing protein [Candidatus Nealsonbacteria bacterium]
MVEEKNTKFCSNCGVEIDKKAKICPKCGVEQPIIPEKVSNWWYFAPLFLGIVGGLIAWIVNKDTNPKKARKLLVIGIVIPILYILAYFLIIGSIFTVSMSGAREKARDAQRQSDIRQISLAMEMYYDENGAYATAKNMDGLKNQGLELYLVTIPKDPLNDEDYSYYFINNTSDSQRYCVYAELEGGGFFTASREGTFTITNKPSANNLDCGR